MYLAALVSPMRGCHSRIVIQRENGSQGHSVWEVPHDDFAKVCFARACLDPIEHELYLESYLGLG